MRTQRVISIVRCHAEGEVGDVIVGGVLPPPGNTMFERMSAMQRDQDGLRRLLLCEPRGSVARHINLITPPARDDCDIGMITMEPTEFVPMSGSNLICTVTVALETGIVAMREPETIVRVDTAAGPVRARATCRDGKCVSVEFANVPSFVDRLDASLEIEGLGSVAVDIAYGGMWYAIADATKLGFRIEPDEARDLATLGEKIRLAARAQLRVVHPENAAIAGVSIVQFNRPFAGVGQVHAQHLHRRARPLGPQPHRHRHLRAHGGAARPRHHEGRRLDGPRIDHRLALHGPHRRHGHGGRQAGNPADHRGSGVDHRAGQRDARSERSVPDWLCAGGHLGGQWDDGAVTTRDGAVHAGSGWAAVNRMSICTASKGHTTPPLSVRSTRPNSANTSTSS
jgi:proline racemase